MISEAARKQNLKSLKAVLADSHLKVLGYNIDGKGYAGIFTECTLCGKVSKRSLGYWKQYPNCYCQRGANISATQLAATDVSVISKVANVRFLSPYLGMNKKSTVECLACGNCWDAWVGGLAKGHGCADCARERIKKRSLKLYGVENVSQRPDVIKKRKATMAARYGVEHALQNKELYDKNLKTAFAFKEYKLGKRVVRLQGYEPQAVDYIRRVYKVKPSDIECGVDSDVPSIRYTYRGKQYVYHPDILVKSLNRIVEVKSAYTYRASLKKNLAKKQACLEQGYLFTFFIMDGNGNRLSENSCH